jgi:hypothetical protein
MGSIDSAVELLRSGGGSEKERNDAAATIESYVKKTKSEYLDLEKKVTKEKESQSDLSRSILTSMDDTKNALTYVAGEQRKVLADAISWVTNTKEQYIYSQQVAKQYKLLGRDIGLGAAQSKVFSKSFKESLPYFSKMGMDANDLKETIGAVMESSGRFKGFFPPEDTNRMADMITGLNMSSQSVGEMVDRFDLMGVSVDRMYETISETYGDSQKLGLNAKKVTDVLQQNFKSMQRMSFRSGVKGMTEMAKLAVNMRMDVSDMLGMAKKFYNPEQAIEAAAELQLMGGDIAEAFGDPFEVMYLARNKPEELAKKVGEMTSNMAIFNEETGQYELPAEAIQQLDFMADKLSLSKDKVIDMAYQTSKLKDIKSTFDGTNMFSEEEQSAIASMAKFDTSTGKWKVDFGGESISIDDTGSIQNAIENGMLVTQPDEDPIKQTAKATFTTSEIAKQTLEEIKAQTQNQVDFYSVLEKGMVKPQESLNNILQSIVKNTGDILKDPDKVGEDMSGIMKDPDKFADKFGEKIAEQLETMNDFVNSIMVGDKDMIAILKTKLDLIRGDLTTLITKTGFPAKAVEKAGDGIMSPGGGNLIKKPKGSMSAIVQPDVNDYTFFIQKDKVTTGGSQTSSNATSSEMKVSGTATINVNINSNTDISSNMEGQITNKIIEVYQKIANGGGDVSSVYQAQPSKGSETLYA